MQVSKWGNSLAIRLPQAVVEALDLKEGDQVEINVVDQHSFQIDSQRRRREKALERLRARGWTPPPGWKFSREELYERGGPDSNS
jgi:antitoxin MazE